MMVGVLGVVYRRGCYTRVGGDGARGGPATRDLAFGPIPHGAQRFGVANTSPLLHQMLLTP